MTWAQFVLDFYKWWDVVTFCVATVFVFYYGFAAPWYRSPFGRSLMVMDAGVAVATLPGFLLYIFNLHLMTNRSVGIAVMLASSAITLGISYRVWVLFVTRHSAFWKKLSATRTGKYPDGSQSPRRQMH